VLLRIAIGWHFLYEGMEKWESRHKPGKPFSAEVYLRNSTGPLAPYFRGLVSDVNGLAKLDPPRLKAAWAADAERIANHYRFDGDQRSKLDRELKDSEAKADELFAEKEFTEKRNKYLHQLHDVQSVERKRGALSFERERAAARRKDLDADRKELLARIDTIGGALHEAVLKLATDDQRAASGPLTVPRSSLDWINDLTMYGLIAMGLCLMLGLFTPMAALAGAVFLGQIYLSMPPWPGLPPNPMSEGHYFIVNKNLVEMLALLALVFIPTGQWIGFDAFVFGRRVVLAEGAAVATREAHPVNPAGTNPRATPDDSPIPLSPGVSRRD